MPIGSLQRGVKRHYDGTPIGRSQRASAQSPARSRWPLPNELTAHVLSFAEDRDVLSVRGVSKAMKARVEDPHVWHRRIVARNWLQPAPSVAWADSDMLRHYRVQAAITEGALSQPRHLSCDVSSPANLAHVSHVVPQGMPHLRVERGPTPGGMLALTEDFPHVRHLSIGAHKGAMTASAMSALAGFAHLETVDIGWCNAQLTAASIAALVAAVPKLKSLSLRSADIVGQDLAALAHAPQLQSLTLEDCVYLASFPPELAALTQLTDLDLSGHRNHRLTLDLTTQIAALFPRLRNLNLLGRWTEDGDHNVLVPLAALKLTALNVGQTRIQTLPAALCKPELETLTVERNDNFQFPQEASRMTGLKRVNFSSTEPAAFPSVLLKLTGLEHIDASWNEGMAMDEPMHTLVNLRELDVSECNFETFPQAITTLPNLERLRMAGNGLTRLPLSAARLNKLTHLALHDSVAWAWMPRALLSMDRLQWLSLPMLTKNAQPRFAESFPALRYLRFDTVADARGIESSDPAPRKNKRLRAMSTDDFITSISGCRELRAVAFDAAWWLTMGAGPVGVRARSISSMYFDEAYNR